MRKGNVNNKPKEFGKLDNNVETTLEALDSDTSVNENEKAKSNLETKKGKNKNKLKIIILIIITVLALGITAGMLIYKYLNTNKQQTPQLIGTNNTETEVKKETEDTKYLVSYTDFYEINPINIIDKVYEQKATKKQGSIDIAYLEISGLKNKEIQAKINKEIKDNAYYYSDKTTAKQAYHSYTDIQGNFSNILSIHTYVYVYENEEMVFSEDLYLNYNLATGEQIKFLDLFSSNTPMNSIIYDLEYERLAWDTKIDLDMSEKDRDKATNMDKRDTSEYEDILLKVMNRYKNLDKDEIEFGVTPNMINVNLRVGEGGEEISYVIYLYKYIDYVTLYKKFLTDDIVFESVPKDKLLVFNNMNEFVPEYYKIELDNLFISIFNYSDLEYMKEEEKEQIAKYSQKVVNKKKELVQKRKEEILDEVRNLAKSNKNKGYMARFMPYSSIDEYSNDYGSEVLIYISFDGAIEEMNINYYKENAFKLLAAQNARRKASIDEVLIGRIAYADNKNVKSLLYNENEENIIDLSGYYTTDGTLIAKTYEEVEKYLDSKYTKPEPEPLPEETPNEQTEIEIYEER